ncbi:MAG TPA: DUF1015 domain-containing protein [Dissulfurispiraceae bacterium]
MATILPFKGLLYNPERVKGDEVIAPPYDIISAEYKETLYRKSPYNIVRVDFGKELPDDTEGNNKYTRAGSSLGQWIREGILVRDEKPSFYAYEIDYRVAGEEKTLRGILAMVKLEELGKGVYPHEATHSKPKADRLNLMRACRANVSPIYSLYSSPEKITSNILKNMNGAPYMKASDLDGAVHKLFKISDEAKIELITKELYGKPIFIADGHHRYEVALEFKREMDKSGGGGLPRDPSLPRPWDYIMMFLANTADEGITILPTHRMVRGISGKDDILGKLEKDFSIRQCPLNADIVRTVTGEGKNAFGLYVHSEDRWHVLQYKGNSLGDIPSALRDLEVVVLHELILKRDLGITDIAYEMDVDEAMGRVRRKDFDGLFVLSPTKVEDVERVALSNLRMPPKSTYFYPKLLTGMVINSFR